jgi:hypothetical protein
MMHAPNEASTNAHPAYQMNPSGCLTGKAPSSSIFRESKYGRAGTQSQHTRKGFIQLPTASAKSFFADCAFFVTDLTTDATRSAA